MILPRWNPLVLGAVPSWISGKRVGSRGCCFLQSAGLRDQETSDGPAEVSFPAGAGGPGGFGWEHREEGAAVEEDDKDGEEDAESISLVEAHADEEAEVAKDDGAGAYVVGCGRADEKDDNSGDEGGCGGDEEEIAPAFDEDGGSENEEGDRVADEVTPASMEKGGEEESLDMGEFAGVNPVLLQVSSKEQAVGDFDDPESGNDPGVLGQAFPIGGGLLEWIADNGHGPMLSGRGFCATLEPSLRRW